MEAGRFESFPVGLDPTETDYVGLRPQYTEKPRQNSHCRFSLRKLGQSDAWNPKPITPESIRSGDYVQLFCHSLGLGPFANVNRPPVTASPAHFRDPCDGDFRELAFHRQEDFLPASAQELLAAYDSGTLQAADTNVFELRGSLSTEGLARKAKDTRHSTRSDYERDSTRFQSAALASEDKVEGRFSQRSLLVVFE